MDRRQWEKIREAESNSNIKGFTHHENANRMIAKSIIRAQAASDSGKGIDELETKTSLLRTAKHQGYDAKSKYILDAIKRINGSKKPTAFFYYVEDHSYRYILVYFAVRYKYVGTHQISFHVPKWEAREFGLDKFIGKGRVMRWDKELGGSRKTAQFLINLYRL